MFLHSPTHDSPTHMCWICGKAVDIQKCKTDEHGSIVHGLCYAAKIALAKRQHGCQYLAESGHDHVHAGKRDNRGQT